MPTKTTQPDQSTKLVASVAADQLGIKAVTLRKYSTMIEKQLNNEDLFRTTGTSHRLYTATDLAAFKAAIALTEQGTTLAEALQKSFDQPAQQPNFVVESTIPTKPVSPVEPQPAIKPVQPSGPSNEELYKQQQIMIRRLDSLNHRLNQVLVKLDQQAAPKPQHPWWQFWRY
ncbi:MerR family transcriptional regulator [Lactiplantibacillus pingfangensis]|uniref:MerR family transcriptional regulator n=1 Tax=Lactiplantibacillus pingfangensis TaxID=2559915 RepID=UPI0010F8C397|nr:MerR family transcriptional regulator [Lactiplantibacillus pingfangensis]